MEGSKLHADTSLVEAHASCDSVIKSPAELIGRLKAAYAVSGHSKPARDGRIKTSH